MSNKLIYLFIFSSLLLSCQTTQNSCESSKEHTDRYRTKIRNNPYPNRHSLEINPPSFLWPASKQDKKSTTFKIKLVKKGSVDTIESNSLKWAAWKPSKVLEPGTWLWTLEKFNNNKKTIVGFYSFNVQDDLPNYNPPIISKEMITKTYGKHPRFFQLNATASEVTQRLPQDLQQTILKNATLFLKKEPVTNSNPFEKINKSLNQYETNRVKIIISKKILNHLRLKVLYLAQAYTLTNNDIYANAALENLKVFEALPDEVKQLNDFTRGMSLDLGLYMFDGFYHQLSENQKKYLINLCYPIIHHEYEGARMRFETNEFDNHVWQKGVALLARASLIMGNHIPEATDWMEYIAMVWAARGPAGGFNYDGAWVNGNNYMTANIVTLIQTPMILNKISGFNYLSHPWYQNLAQAMITTYQGRSYSNGFGDGHDSTTMPVWIRGQLAQYVARITQNPNLTWYANQIALSERGVPPTVYGPESKHPLDSEAHQWLTNTMAQQKPEAIAPTFDRGSVFPFSGFASFHSNLLESNSNMHLAFRSSIYGSGSHTMSNQNAFNVLVGGKPLFLSSGYYTNFADKHNLMHYRNTRGHNTILINGIGQSLGKHGYGEIEESLVTKDIAYVRGDASNAYRGDLRDPMWIKNFKKADVTFTEDNGYGVTTLNTYKRHLLMLDDRTIIVYDELGANMASKFNWLLHTPGTFNLISNNEVKATTSNANAVVHLESSTTLNTTISDEFSYKAENWSGKKVNGKLVEYSKQWHLNASTETAEKVYILGIIQVDGAGTTANKYTKISQGVYKIGDWELNANLEASKKATLTLYNSKTNTVFNVGSKEFKVNNNLYRSNTCDAFYKSDSNKKIMSTKYLYKANN